jgi:hypothetical protein
MSEKADALMRSVQAHSEDRALELASSLGLTVEQFASAKMMQMRIEQSPKWFAPRSPHGLMVDCIYLVAKKSGMKISAVKMRNHTMKIFGVGTQPRASVWQDDFTDVIEEYT